jgi:CheY-like chemotaxis protein
MRPSSSCIPDRKDKTKCERKKALVVDDEPLLRMLAADMLAGLGFVPIEAACADDAVAVFAADPSIRHVLTDIQMPGSLDGVALARLVLSIRPSTSVVVASGMLRPLPPDLADEVAFLAKPYDIRALRAYFESVGRHDRDRAAIRGYG